MKYSRCAICVSSSCLASAKASRSLSQLFSTPWTMRFSRPVYWNGRPFPSPGDLPNPGIKPRSSALQVDSLPAEPQWKPKNPGVGSLSFLQRIFWTQELNQGLLHCRRILYQLSYKGSPGSRKWQPTPVFLPGESQGGGAWWAAIYGVPQSRT